MLIETAWKNYKDKVRSRENYREGYHHSSVRIAFCIFVTVFVLALLVIIPMAIYFTISPDFCGDRIPTWGKVLIILLFFVPYVGLPIAIFIIIVGLTTCSKGKQRRPLSTSLKSVLNG